MGITEQTARRGTQQLLCHPVIRVGVVTAGPEFTLAEKTISTGNGKRHHHTIANLQLIAIDASADFDHLTHELVAHDVALLHGGNETVIEVQVGAADTSTGNSNDGVASIQNLRVRYGFHAHFSYAHPTDFLRFAFKISLISASPRIGRSGSAKRKAATASERGPCVCPSIVGISPVSISALNRRRSCRIMNLGSLPSIFATARAAAPPGGRYSTRAITSVPRPAGAGRNFTYPSTSISESGRERHAISSFWRSSTISASHRRGEPKGPAAIQRYLPSPI